MDTDTDPLIGSKQPCLFPEEDVPSLFLEPNQVYMDCMAFGMGCCCLQVTFQAADMSQARFIYDQFAILSPLMVKLNYKRHFPSFFTLFFLAGLDCGISCF
jgi:hypothetical protein